MENNNDFLAKLENLERLASDLICFTVHKS